jgi:AcrR family transcriptional regulator
MSTQVGSGAAMPQRRRDMAEWRREQILDAALLVFGTKGVHAASMKEVAAAAGVTSGLLYHYFTSKEALSLAVTVERGFLSDLRSLLSEKGERPAVVVHRSAAASQVLADPTPKGSSAASLARVHDCRSRRHVVLRLEDAFRLLVSRLQRLAATRAH